MSDATIQVIRSVVQAFWSAVLGLAFVDEILLELGLNPRWTEGVAVTLSMAIIIGLARVLPRLHPLLGNLVSGVNRAPAYQGQG